MAHATHLLPLFILIQLYSLATPFHGHGHGNTTSSRCHPHQAAALLELKQSFIFDYSTTTLSSWQPGTDCCLWEGIGCDDSYASDNSSNVTILDLGGRGLYSYGCHVALFNLTSLRYLDLSMNYFGLSRIPAIGFERLSELTHLNLSHSGFTGQIPIAIGKLTSLISLDLSIQHYSIESYDTASVFELNKNYLLLQEPSFENLVSNLTNLRELYLSGVRIYGSGEEWCNGLAKGVPRLRVLSLATCVIQGRIHSSLSSLQYFTMINLNNNDISGVIPEFFTGFLNLSVLQLSSNRFSGWFPQRIFQLENMRVLDVSGNTNLSGHLPEFRNGTSMETLSLHCTNFSGIKLSSFSNLLSLRDLGFDGGSISIDPTDLSFHKLNSLQKLQLSFLLFSGELGLFSSWVSSLKNLSSLKLSYCSSSKIMTSLIGNLASLTSLEITNSGFSGKIPPSVGNLYKLTSLRISDCAFSGIIPSSIGNLKKLSLEIIHSGLSGPITTYIGRLNNLKALVLKGCRFSGRIPSTIVNLTQLVYLDLSSNDLTGEVPTHLFTSPAMLQLDLSSNQLSGPIQEFDTLYSQLRIIYLRENKISGQIPASLLQLKSLVGLDLCSNNLTGSLQLSSLWKLRKLYFLCLSDNMLSVLDGESNKSMVPLLPKLGRLQLASCNMTTIPYFLMHVNHIEILDLSRNKIKGSIPQWIWESWADSLTRLNLSNNIFTHMKLTSYVLPCNYLDLLDLSFNRLQGQIPMPNMLTTITTYPQILDYSNNNFSSLMSNFTAYLHQTSHFKLSRNNISGHIPPSICDSRNLVVLDLSHNNFSGLIPSCLIEDSQLIILNLRENHFEGTLPSNVSAKCHLQTINLHGNKIEGQLPRSLSNCVDLEVLDIGNNQIADSFPSWLGRLSSFRVLVLKSNQFYGSLAYPTRNSKSEEYLSKLQIIDISSNIFSGNLNPRWFESFTSMTSKFNDTGNTLDHLMWYSDLYYETIEITYKGQPETFRKVWTTLMVIDFSNNAFDGDIPESTGRLISLRTLNMSHNAFTGRIPSQIGEMRLLESLDLSWNKLSGEIPPELTDLTFLSTLNLCENKLGGKIPLAHQFSTFGNTSYEGNAGLCGPPLSKPCGDSSHPNEASISTLEIMLILFCFSLLGWALELDLREVFS